MRMKKSKKITFLLTAIIILLICITVGLSYTLWERKDWVSPTENIQNIIIQNSIEAEEPVNFELDVQYNEAIKKAYSNVEEVQVNDGYADKWDEFADEYYNKLLEIANDDFKESLIVSQNEWEKYAEISEKMQLEYLQNIYEYGTIVPVESSYYHCELHRERAVELYEMYEVISR